MKRARRSIPNLLPSWRRIEARLRACEQVLLFLDFDGTLVRIASHPQRVRVPAATRRILGRLAQNGRVTVVVISGRRRAELRRTIGVEGVHYWGLYGWEHNRGTSIPASVAKRLRRTGAALSRGLAPLSGVWIEDKRFSLSVHLLKAPQQIQQRIRRVIRTILRRDRKSLRVFENLRDVEIVPCFIHGKGTAVRNFLAQRKARHALPIYFGDDISDEDAFAAVERGIGVHVGAPRATRAHLRVRGPGEVTAALRKLEASLR